MYYQWPLFVPRAPGFCHVLKVIEALDMHLSRRKVEYRGNLSVLAFDLSGGTMELANQLGLSTLLGGLLTAVDDGSAEPHALLWDQTTCHIRCKDGRPWKHLCLKNSGLLKESCFETWSFETRSGRVKRRGRVVSRRLKRMGSMCLEICVICSPLLMGICSVLPVTEPTGPALIRKLSGYSYPR